MTARVNRDELHAVVRLPGPYEHIVYRSRVRAHQLRILRPPMGASYERMLTSLQWIGRRWADIGIADLLTHHPRLVNKMIVLSGREPYQIDRLDFCGTWEMRKIGLKPGTDVPMIVRMHPCIIRDTTKGPWRIEWVSGSADDRSRSIYQSSDGFVEFVP